jgi:hypothetical protein
MADTGMMQTKKQLKRYPSFMYCQSSILTRFYPSIVASYNLLLFLDHSELHEIYKKAPQLRRIQGAASIR